jgi:iron complex outermembrane recepter protein
MSISWIALAMAQAAQPAIEPAQDTVLLIRTEDAEIIIVRGKIEKGRKVPASVVRVDPVNILTVDDLATAVPGVWMVNDQDPGTNILSIRGATTDRLQQASVAFIFDGLPLADTELFTARLFDVDKIEVLKGPQGALYGKNAAGGVIAIVNQGARVEGVINDDGQIQARIGDGGLAEVEFGKSFALSDTWAVRAAGVWSSADGWIKNTTLDKLVDSTQTKAIRLNLMGSAVGFDVDVRAQWLEEEGGAAWASSNNVTGKNKGRLSGAVLINPIGDYEGRAARRWLQTSARAGRTFDHGRLDVLIARDSYQKRWTEELDYRPGALTFFGFPAFPNGIQPIAQPIDIRATTLQGRWTSSLEGAFNFQIGAFAQDTDKDRVDDFGPLLFGGALTPNGRVWWH